jgi:transcriptional antiterminator NusG
MCLSILTGYVYPFTGEALIVSHTTRIEIAASDARDWFAFRVRPRHEKSIALQLGEKSEEYFLPLVREKRKWGNRVAHVDLPLLPGYVFCRSRRFGLLPILKVPGVIDVLRAGASPVPIPEDEINALKTAVAASMRMEACPYIDVGQKVQIRSGPLAGLTGIVIEVSKAKKLVLSVTLLRRSVLVHLETDAVTDTKALMLSEFDHVA